MNAPTCGPQSVLVTGITGITRATGFAGSGLSGRLVGAGHTVLASDNLSVSDFSDFIVRAPAAERLLAGVPA